MKKIILFILLTVLLTGCTAEVNIDISSDSINEQISIVAYGNDNISKEQLYSGFRKNLPVYYEDRVADMEEDVALNGVTYYNRREKDLGTGYNFVYDYKFVFGNYKNAYSLKRAFKSPLIQKSDVNNEILISTDNGGLLYFDTYPDLESVKININPEYKVKNSNADYVNNGVYTWIFNRNSNNKGIYLLLDTSVDDEPTTDEDDKNTNDSLIKKNENKEKEYDNVFLKFINEHPFITALLSIVIFIIFVIILSKLFKVK